MNTTKRKKKKGVVATSAVLLAIMLTASACASGNTDKPNQNNESNQNQATEQPSDASPTPDSENDGNAENGSNNGSNGVTDTETGSPDAPANTDKGSNSPDNSAALAKEGVYGGQIDTTSIEVTVDGDPLVLQITDTFTDTLNKLKPDDKIKIEYTEKNIDGVTLLYLNKLEKL